MAKRRMGSGGTRAASAQAAAPAAPETLGASNWRVRVLRQLDQRKHREAEGLTLVEGARLVEAAALAGARFRMLVATEQALAGIPPAVAELAGQGVEFFVASPAVMDRIAPTATPSGLLAAVEVPKRQLPAPPYGRRHLFLCLEEVADPGNTGTLVRSADASGASAVLVMGGADPWNPKAVRATMGSCFHLPVVTIPAADGPSCLVDLKAAGMRIACTSPHASLSLWECDLRGPIALVLGSEARGVARGTIAQADALVTIPNFGRAESLNVAQAGTVLLFEAARQISCASRPAQL